VHRPGSPSGTRKDSQRGPVTPPRRATALLRLDPRDHRVPPVAPVTAELDVRQQPGARVLAHPPLRHMEKLGDLHRVEEPIRHERAFSAATGTNHRYKAAA